MTWRELLGAKRVAKESTDRTEIQILRKMAHRSLDDAHAKGLSNDGRFGLAYDAVRVLATIVVRACGYRPKKEGGAHYNTFQALNAAGPEFESLAVYFDACRRKRNEFNYEASEIVSGSESEELVLKAAGFGQMVDSWLKKH